jgi:hypothetical protein
VTEKVEKSLFCSYFVLGAADERVFYARDMESVEEGPNAEKNKTVGWAKDSAAGVS